MRRLPNRGPFTVTSSCDVCGHTGASTRYCAPHSRRPGCPNMGEQDGPHLHRACARCQFEWVETPLNEDA